MQVCKLYFMLLKKNLPSLLIYMAIFLSIMIYITLNSSSSSSIDVFSENKVKVAFVNEDKNTTLINGFRTYLDKSCEFVEIENNETALKDALFFRKVVYIIRIPNGFTEKFLNGEQVQIEKTSVPNVAEAVSVDMAINRFFQTAKVYGNYIDNLSQEKLVTLVEDNLDIKAEVSMFSENTIENNRLLVTYYNFISYGLVSMLVLGVGMIMLSIQKIDIKRRTFMAPMSTTRINIQLILGNFIFTLGFLAVLIIGGAMIIPGYKLDKTSVLLILSALVFSISVISISFLVGITIKGKGAANALANILSLGMAFISGAFVPQELLGEELLKVAAFTPSYWFVKANNIIGSMTEFTAHNLEEVFRAMLIQLGFAAAIFAISLVVSKKKSQETA